MTRPGHRVRIPAVLLAAGAVLAGCGGGGGGGNASVAAPPPPANTNGWTAGEFSPATTFKDRCMNPRTGTDPDTGLPYADSPGMMLDENNWLRSWSNELYLWYDEIVDRDPGLYSTSAYFGLLRTDASTASGQPKDRFHYAIDTDEWRLLSQSGVSADYGARFAILAGAPPREVVVVFTEPGGPADLAGIRRGARLLEIDGVDVIDASDSASIDVLNAGLNPASAGETHTFTFANVGAPAPQTASLTTATVVADPVPVADWVDLSADDRIGYLLFNSHIGTAQQALIDAVDALATADIDDLVLDLRYNGGGFLFIASQLAYMIAGQPATAGRTFELLAFNDKHPNINPVTGNLLEPLPFLDVTVAVAGSTPGQPLPTLDLPRVFVLTGGATCSASESVINALRGVGIDVIQIGGTTCGKPYGFHPQDNCGTTYFSIQFQGVNDAGFGDYGDGFEPQTGAGVTGRFVPGCPVNDDYEHALGDPDEGQFAAALQFRAAGICPPAPAMVPGTRTDAAVGPVPGDIELIRPPWESMRWLESPSL